MCLQFFNDAKHVAIELFIGGTFFRRLFLIRRSPVMISSKAN